MVSGKKQTDESLKSSRADALLQRSAGVRRLILLTVVVGFPLIVAPGLTFDEYNVPKLTLLGIGIGLAAALRLAEDAMGRSRDHLWRLALPAAALTLPLVLAWTFSPFKGWALLGEYSRFQGVLPYLAFALFGILLTDAFVGRSNLLAWAIATSAGIAGLYAFTQFIGMDPLPWTTPRPVGSYPTTTIGNTNFSGAFFAMTLPVAVGLWRTSQRPLLAIVLTVLIAEGWLFSVSQGAWFAGLTALVVVAALLWRPESRWARQFAGVAVVGAGAFLVAITLLSSTRDVPFVGPTVELRGMWWQEATQLWLESPLVGNGPNAFAIEGIRYRMPEHALVTGDSTADDPHSVLFSFLSAAGIVGLSGYALAAGWAAHTAGRMRDINPMTAGFAGSAAAYFIQSLGSIDEPTLRLGLWVALSGLATTAVARASDTSSTTQRSRIRFAAGALVAVILGAILITSSVLFAAADRDIAMGQRLMDADAMESGVTHFERALRTRDDPDYRAVYGTALADASVRNNLTDPEDVQRIHAQFEYLDSFPDIDGTVLYARSLAAMSWFDPRVQDEAAEVYRIAQELDPHNPILAAELAEVLVGAGDYSTAHAVLARFETRPVGFSRFWAAIAITRAKSGDHTDAVDALTTATAIEQRACHVLIAREIVRGKELSNSTLPTRLINLRLACPPAAYRMLQTLVPPARRYIYT